MVIGVSQQYWGPAVAEVMDRRSCSSSTNLAPSYTPEGDSLESFQTDIANHAETRAQLFLQQSLLFYKTNLCFAKNFKAAAQIGQAHNGFHAAHCSTLPMLRLATNSEGLAVSVAHRTFFYHTWNTTICLPTIVNNLDSSIDGKGLRESALNILNRVSAGEIDPKAGLLLFLNEFISLCSREQEERSRLRGGYSKVAESYLQVGRAYQKKLEEDDPIIQKFCLEPQEAIVNDDFYLRIQSEMHELLRSELSLPSITALPTLSLNLQLLQSRLSSLLGPVKALKSGSLPKFEEYAKYCVTVNAIRVVAMNCLQDLDQMTLQMGGGDHHFHQVLISRVAPVMEPLINQQIMNVYGVKNAQDISKIVLKSLLNICQDLLAERRPLTDRLGAIAQTPQVLKIRSCIRKKIIQLAVDSKAAAGYVHNCMEQEKARFAAQDFFNSLLSLDDASVERTVELLGLCNNKKSLKTATKSVIEFYNDVLQSLPNKKLKNVNWILCRFLEVLLERGYF